MCMKRILSILLLLMFSVAQPSPVAGITGLLLVFFALLIGWNSVLNFLRLPSFIAPWLDRPGNRGFSAGRELWLVGIIKPNYLDGRCSMAS